MQNILKDARVAVISDIHGNLAALRVALETISSMGINQLLFLGDLLGYYYEASECLDLLNNFDLFSVKGNHEEMYIKIKQGLLDSNSVKLKYGSSLTRTVSSDNARIDSFVENLPLVRDIRFENTVIRMAHGDFLSCDNYIYPDASAADIRFADLPEIEFVLLGNTHLQMLRIGQWTNLVNPGSIGMCRSRINNVQFATINLLTKSIAFHNVHYSPSATLSQVQRFDPQCKILSKYIR